MEGTFRPPPFSDEDMEEIAARMLPVDGDIDSVRTSKNDGLSLCHCLRRGIIVENRHTLQTIIERADQLQDKQLKTDVFRLVAEMKRRAREDGTSWQ